MQKHGEMYLPNPLRAYSQWLLSASWLTSGLKSVVVGHASARYKLNGVNMANLLGDIWTLGREADPKRHPHPVLKFDGNKNISAWIKFKPPQNRIFWSMFPTYQGPILE